MFRRDRLGVKLHAPQRPVGMFYAHHNPIVGPRDHAAFAPERAGHRERVVAHDIEALRDAVEQTAAGVLYLGEAPVHHDRSGAHRRFEHVSEALVAEAHTEHGDNARAQDVRGDAEMVPALRAARPG